ncbi:MAG: hypothetical protein KA713_05030 [Chryseotalea sp. WA131a]|nr:MAG: hypothetical protein KA713_05030 [Chryseotalea sp. WA131a]
MPPLKKLSATLTQKLLSIKKLRKNQLSPIAEDWIYLQESELFFIDFMKSKKEPAVGNMEYGPALYLLHQLPKVVVDVLIFVMGMPPTQIKKVDWDKWLHDVEHGPGVVAGDGTIYLFKKYAQLDFGWTESLVYYLYYRHEKRKDAKFGITPVTTKIPKQNSLTIAIVGDWGTGVYSDEGFEAPSQLVKNAINALKLPPLGLPPDITLHLRLHINSLIVSLWQLNQGNLLRNHWDRGFEHYGLRRA